MNIDLNSVNEQELSRVPGLDQSKARQIIEFRNRVGTFKTFDDLKKIPGLPQGILDVLQKAGATVGRKPAA